MTLGLLRVRKSFQKTHEQAKPILGKVGAGAKLEWVDILSMNIYGRAPRAVQAYAGQATTVLPQPKLS